MARPKSTKSGAPASSEAKNYTHPEAESLLRPDVFDPVAMQNDHRPADDVPCYLLDTDYNGLCFHVSQAFEAGEHGEVAVKVIVDRGNEFMVVKSMKEAES